MSEIMVQCDGCGQLEQRDDLYQCESCGYYFCNNCTVYDETGIPECDSCSGDNQ